MLYSETRYPDEMRHLPEDVRRIAIKKTNEMLVDGNIRHHRDLIIVIAISKAKKWAKENGIQNVN